MSEVEGEPHVVATYREVAAHFGLRGPTQGRTKAQRAGWPSEPRNHPAEPVRVRVPRAAWEGALQARERGLSRRQERGELHGSVSQRGSGGSRTNREPPALPPEVPALVKQLEATHATLREQLVRAEERAAEAQREQMRLRGELDAWTAGGPLARAWRALRFRRRAGPQ
jgi:hypothetical protein